MPYLKPDKWVVADLVVTKTGLERALSFANALFWRLEDAGYRVMIAPSHDHFHRADVDPYEVKRKNFEPDTLWLPRRPTLVYLGTLPIGLTIVELSELSDAKSVGGDFIRLEPSVAKRMKVHDREGWRVTKHDFPSNRLCLQAYSPYWRAKWTWQWREGSGEDLTKRLSEMVKELIQAVPGIIQLVEEADRKAKLERHRWEEKKVREERERAEQLVAEAHQGSRKQLVNFIDTWGEARRINAFFDEVAAHLGSQEPNVSEQLRRRLDRARQLIGTVDALGALRKWQAPEELLAAGGRSDESDD